VVVALSRCMMGRHHFSDVMAGLLLGSLTLYIVTRVRSYCYLL
jgi:membrane-associated phospholipid phosphatase